MMSPMHPDSELIKRLGGVAEVARKMGYGAGGIQRVHNWLHRGIPPRVKLERSDLFLKPAPKPRKSAEAPAYQGPERRDPRPAIERGIIAPRNRATDKPNNCGGER